MICLPTASGKTVVFSALIKRLLHDYQGVSVLILAHRKELITQAESKLLAVWPEAPVGVYAAGLGRRELNRITIASRDTIAPVIDAIGQFTFVFIDEAHRMSVKDEGRYRKLIGKLRERYEHLVVIGFTATPFRLGQGKIYGPGKPFADLAYRRGMLDLIKQGYLAPLTSLVPATGTIDIEGVRTLGGDFNERELEQRATSTGVVRAALGEWLAGAYQQGRKASVFFCVSVRHAGMVAEELARAGIGTAVVTGETPAAERDNLLASFADGKIPTICNVGVLTEGWDCPRTDCIVLLRPTKSASLYVQMVGRGLRLSPETGKRDCLVLDFSGNIDRLGPVDQADEPEPTQRKAPPSEGIRCGDWDVEIFQWIDGCGHQNEPNAKVCAVCKEPLIYKRCGTRNEEDKKWHNGCGRRNFPSATECRACGQPFVRHDVNAKQGGIVSNEQVISRFEVENIAWRVSVSQASGRSYLRLTFFCGLFEVYYKNLMLGYPGYSGERARQEWLTLTQYGTQPQTPEEAIRLLDAAQEQLRPVTAILVDIASHWKEILRIEYANPRANAA